MMLPITGGCNQLNVWHAMKKKKRMSTHSLALLDAGFKWADENVDFKVDVPTAASKVERVVMNGNQAIGFGAIAAGMELCAMYPITPATSASHHLGDVFEKMGGIVHQADAAKRPARQLMSVGVELRVE